MIGIDAISAHNGWAMAWIGISIVFIGLVFLSFAVSQIKKLISFWEKKMAPRERKKNNPSQDEVVDRSQVTALSKETKIAIRKFKLLTERLGEPFSLPRLLKLAQTAGLRHAVEITEKLIETGLILPDDKGEYAWSSSAFDSNFMQK